MMYEFAVPPKYQALLAAGKLIRRGALLIDPQAGQIVAHLQETQKLAQAFGLMGNPASLALNIAQQGIGALNTIQLEQVKKRLDQVQQTLGVIEGLQAANLATSLVGIGVTVVSTAIVCQRINLLRDDIKTLEREVGAFRDEWRMTRLQELLGTAMTCVERVGSSRHRNDPVKVLTDAETVLHEVFNETHRSGQALLKMENIPIEAIQVVIDGLMISGATRIKALLLLDEGAEARLAAERQVRALGDLTLTMPSDVLMSKLTGIANPVEVTRQVSAVLSEARSQAASVPHLVEHLDRNGMRPSEFLRIADEEKDAPILFLPQTDR